MDRLKKAYDLINRAAVVYALRSRLMNDSDQLMPNMASLVSSWNDRTEERLVATTDWFAHPGQRVQRTPYGIRQDETKAYLEEQRERSRAWAEHLEDEKRMKLSGGPQMCEISRIDERHSLGIMLPARVQPELGDMLFQALLDKAKPGSDEAKALAKLYQETRQSDGKLVDQDQVNTLAGLMSALKLSPYDVIASAFRLNKVLGAGIKSPDGPLP